ncbi:MAG: hypothetical protein AAFV90_25220 [Cyanobacteria bacterium J06634_5]
MFFQRESILVAHNIKEFILKKISTPMLLIVAIIAISINSVTRGPALLSAVVITAATVVLLKQGFLRVSTRSGKHTRRRLLLSMSFISSLAFFFLLSLFSDPAHAFLFERAQEWFLSAFEEMDETTIKLVFNVLRGLYILYIGISMVQIVNSVQQDEDWQTAARVPLVAILTVQVSDVLTTVLLPEY